MNNITEIETEISAIYRWYAKEAPGVIVQEVGHLANLWALAARLSPEEYPDG